MAGLPDRSTPSRALGFRAAGSAGLPLVRPKRADCASAFFENAPDHLEGAPHEHKPGRRDSSFPAPAAPSPRSVATGSTAIAVQTTQ